VYFAAKTNQFMTQNICLRWEMATLSEDKVNKYTNCFAFQKAVVEETEE
jgi:hypothetical protein